MKERSRRMQPIHVAHGGRVYQTARRWGIEPHQVLDFSANINPLGPPLAVLSAIEDALTPISLRVYPDPHNCVRAIADKHRLMPDEIVVGSGAASLIFAVMHALSPKRVLILELAFVEYSRASAAVNAQKTTELLTEERCEACGETFACEISLGKGCWCGEIKLSDETRQELRRKYKSCLCRACLEKAAATNSTSEAKANAHD